MPFSTAKNLTNVAMALDYTEGELGDLTYRKYSDYVSISDCDSTVVTVDIPAEIEGLPVTSIGYQAFKNCSSLTDITIPDSVTEIDAWAFQTCSSLTEITIPNSVTEIDLGAFAFCSNLTKITLSENITELSGFIFEDCTSLPEITIPSSVTKINMEAFEDCSSLTEIIIPENVTEIGLWCFNNCTNLTKITFLNPDCKIGSNNKTISNADGVYNGTIYGYEGSTAQTYAEKNGYTFVVLDEEETPPTAGTGELGFLSYEKYSDYVVITDCNESAESVDIPAEIEGLPVKSIGLMAFDSCSNLTNVTIPDSVTTIGNSAFADCKNLTDVTIPESVTNIGAGVFRNTPWLENKRKENPLVIVNDILIDGKTCEGEVTIPDNVKNISSCAFESCSNLTSITIPNSITNINYGVFRNCLSLKSIIIPDSVISIDNGAFDGCFSLENITIPDSVINIGSYVFQDCSNLKSITIPNSVTNVGDNVFSFCSNLTNVTLSDSITSIGTEMFQKCSSLTEITIPDSVTEIGSYAFVGCSSLTEITIPDSVISIGGEAFDETPWLKNKREENPLVIVNNILIDGQPYEENVVIPDGVTAIGGFAFVYCSNLTEITIPNSVTYIDYEAFSHCENLEKITILNPDCKIYDDSYTISNDGGTYNGVICGYEGSTAQKYAKKYGYTFEILENIPEKPAVVLGDANGDGEVNMADVASIVQYIGNKDTYALTEQGALNADCDGQEGITGNDALAIQLLLAQQIDKLPYVE